MKKYIAIAIVAIVGLAVLLQTDAFGIKGFGKMQKMHRMKHIWRNMLNLTREEGMLEYENGTYYINGIPLYLGNEWFLNSIAKSDYDMDGNYEYVWQELEGLVGNEVVVNGVMRNGVLYVSHINGMWLRIPKQGEIAEINGVLELIDGKYYVNSTQLIIKKGFSKSDIDRDGSLERMWEELNGLVGQEIKVDGFMKGDKIVVLHINGIWAR